MNSAPPSAATDTPPSQGLTRPATLDVTVKKRLVIAEDVVLFVLESADGSDLPEWTPGSHIDVHLGPSIVRQYSLCGNPADRSVYWIAVLKESKSRGGSLALHVGVKVQQNLKISLPRNNFPLVEAEEYLLIAGGIGITPLLTMARNLDLRGKRWRMLYGGRTRSTMSFVSDLEVYADKVLLRPQDEYGLLDLEGWIGRRRENVAIYCCGPEPLISAVEKVCEDWPDDTLQVERFSPATGALDGDNEAFDVELARTGITVHVGPNQSIAEAVEDAGTYIPRSCNEGTCGTCITKVLEGIPDHRDSFLREKQKKANNRIMPCCSRAKSKTLILDL